MGVFKEVGDLASKIDRLSIQIWPDAADKGIIICKRDDCFLKMTKDIAEAYQMELETVKWDTGARQTFHFDGGVGGYVEAGFEKAKFTFIRTINTRGMYGYLYVETFTSDEVRKQGRAYLSDY